MTVLAILPGLLGALGAHLAAEGLQEEKRRRSIKVIFWAMCLVWVLVTFWQQFRAAEADLDRAAKDVWAQALATSKFLPPPPPANIERGKRQAIPRSYVVLSDNPRFAGGDAEGKPFAVGEAISFNLYYKQQGPNSVDLVECSRWLYVEGDYQAPTQKALINDFEEKLKSTQPDSNRNRLPSTLMPGDSRFFSVSAAGEKGTIRVITQTDLDNFKIGTEVIFVITQLRYKDAGTEHHLRRCMYLQPPAAPPGIWHFCDGFTHSD